MWGTGRQGSVTSFPELLPPHADAAPAKSAPSGLPGSGPGAVQRQRPAPLRAAAPAAHGAQAHTVRPGRTAPGNKVTDSGPRAAPAPARAADRSGGGPGRSAGRAG